MVDFPQGARHEQLSHAHTLADQSGIALHRRGGRQRGQCPVISRKKPCAYLSIERFKIHDARNAQPLAPARSQGAKVRAGQLTVVSLEKINNALMRQLS